MLLHTQMLTCDLSETSWVYASPAEHMRVGRSPFLRFVSGPLPREPYLLSFMLDSSTVHGDLLHLSTSVTKASNHCHLQRNSTVSSRGLLLAQSSVRAFVPI